MGLKICFQCGFVQNKTLCVKPLHLAMVMDMCQTNFNEKNETVLYEPKKMNFFLFFLLLTLTVIEYINNTMAYLLPSDLNRFSVPLH